MTISLRIVHLDHYLAIPGPLDRIDCPFSDQKIQKIPVLRVFGSVVTVNRIQKICVHVHQVYPYFFIPYQVPDDNDIERDLLEFGTSLNEALNLATNTSKPHIAALILTKGKRFYGFSQHNDLFLKIYILDPQEKQQLLDVLQSSGALNRRHQPYEAHLNFELQFLIDHNLYGMDLMHLERERVRFRHEGRESHCELEVDVVAKAILNRQELEEHSTSDHYHQTKLVKSLESIWKDEVRRRQARGVMKPIPPVTQVENRTADPEPWLSEAALRKLLEKRLSHNEIEREEPSILKNVMSTFQAVEALYDDDKRNPFQIVVSNREWKDILPSQLNKTILHSFIDESMIEEEDDGDVDNVDQQEDVSREDDVSYFDDEDEEETNNILAKWLEKSEPTLSLPQPSTTAIRYETDISSLEKGQMGHVVYSQPSDREDLIEDEQISQVDGPNDSEEGRQRQRKNKTAAERWEEEKKILKRMRLRKTATDMQMRKSREQQKLADSMKSATSSTKPQQYHTINNRERDMRVRQRKISDEQENEYLQKVTVVIPRYHKRKKKKKVETTSSSPLEKASKMIQEPKVVITENENSKITPNVNVTNVENDVQLGQDTNKEIILVYNRKPPSVTHPSSPITYQEPFYSKASDRPPYPTVFAGKEFKLPVGGLTSLEEFKSTYSAEKYHLHTRIRSWMPSKPPPSYDQIQEWLCANKECAHSTASSITQPNLHYSSSNLFKYSPSKPKIKVTDDASLDFFSLEVHVNTREKLLPDPEQDAVQLMFWSLKKDIASKDEILGIIAMRDFNLSKIGLNKTGLLVDYAETEEDLFRLLIEKVRYYDPDMLIGYEVQNGSWGYLVERGAQLGFHLLDELSRVIIRSETIKRDEWGYKKASMYKVLGRHMLNVWRILRHELSLTSYTFENVVYHLLHIRIPHYSHTTLTDWYARKIPILKNRLVRYYMQRVQLNLDLLDVSQVINRTCESARIYGIDFYAVLTRGSQYVVESILFRIAKLDNYVLITPSRLQVAAQRSLEVLPLVMEPISQFYSSPMVVLDFQSLYPSIIIAYNYCYSTCLGRIRKSATEDTRFGVLDSFEPALSESLKDHINVSPNGVMFVKPDIRKSTLAKMLEELLDTRVMVKRSMNDYKDDSALLRLLDAKQLTLKLVANVTYGYTSASFSGRMPSVEIADSIVATGREILERTIRLINETNKWGAQVVYGDTDSVFVYFPGKTKEEAFVLGNEIAQTVTCLYPAPIKLKFEKVYHPAVLLAKKRYVGFKYESQQDKEPVFEAKGIETVRRDGTAATQTILQSSLKILFRTQDMSELKKFLYEEWTKILSNRVLLQDFIISKEVRMGTYANRGPNGAIVAQAQMNADPRAEPQHSERVPYVVVYRGPNAKLRDKVVPPETLLNNSTLRLDAEYYIRKQIIPPLSRIFNLMGVDILSWYESMPRTRKIEAITFAQLTTGGHQFTKNLSRIDQYYASSHCIVCSKLTSQQCKTEQRENRLFSMSNRIFFFLLCEQCQANPMHTIFTLTTRQQLSQKKLKKLLSTCQECSQSATIIANNRDGLLDIPCDSLDCPVFYQRLRAKEDVRMTLNYDTLIQEKF
ncbi:MAG: hypothetical protein EXX96DRAFT_493093 [Benjaminiella poitrasii]|nr:MAG: hypothetical protein EXX96DRAFT_493093 [Benjaminiella poitrasii]